MAVCIHRWRKDARKGMAIESESKSSSQYTQQKDTGSEDEIRRRRMRYRRYIDILLLIALLPVIFMIWMTLSSVPSTDTFGRQLLSASIYLSLLVSPTLGFFALLLWIRTHMMESGEMSRSGHQTAERVTSPEEIETRRRLEKKNWRYTVVLLLIAYAPILLLLVIIILSHLQLLFLFDPPLLMILLILLISPFLGFAALGFAIDMFRTGGDWKNRRLIIRLIVVIALFILLCGICATVIDIVLMGSGYVVILLLPLFLLIIIIGAIAARLIRSLRSSSH